MAMAMTMIGKTRAATVTMKERLQSRAIERYFWGLASSPSRSVGAIGQWDLANPASRDFLRLRGRPRLQTALSVSKLRLAPLLGLDLSVS